MISYVRKAGKHPKGFCPSAVRLCLYPLRVANEAGPQTVGQASGLPVEAASGPLENLICLQAASDKEAWSNGYHDVLIGPGLEKRPPGYHSKPESDRKLLWHQLSASFPEAVIHGDPTGIGPTPLTDDDPESWGTRLWRSKDYWLLLAGRPDAWPLKEPTRIKLPELPKSVTCAMGFGT